MTGKNLRIAAVTGVLGADGPRINTLWEFYFGNLSQTPPAGNSCAQSVTKTCAYLTICDSFHDALLSKKRHPMDRRCKPFTRKGVARYMPKGFDRLAPTEIATFFPRR